MVLAVILAVMVVKGVPLAVKVVLLVVKEMVLAVILALAVKVVVVKSMVMVEQEETVLPLAEESIHSEVWTGKKLCRQTDR